MSDEEVKVAQASAVPANTKKSTNWAVNVWKDWRESHSKTVQSVVYIAPMSGLLFQPNRLVDWPFFQ